MKVAVFGDVHGNIHALKSVLEDIESHSPDQIAISAGLIISIPFPVGIFPSLQRGNQKNSVIHKTKKPSRGTEWRFNFFSYAK